MSPVPVLSLNSVSLGLRYLRWIEDQTISQDLLVALHSNGLCILWDTQNLKQLWKIYIDESFTSFCIDFRGLRNAILYGSSSFSLADFSTVSGFKDKTKSIEFECVVRNIDSGNKLVNPDIQTSPQSNSSSESTVTQECIQACYHGYREDCGVFLFKRQILLVDLQTTQSVLSITPDKTVSSFLGLYSCRLRDLLICLHENGNLSVYARRGLACPFELVSANRPSVVCSVYDRLTEQSHDTLAYDLVAHGERSRRLRQSVPVHLTVDRAREVAIAITAPEGRIQFWQLRALRPRPLHASRNETAAPVWCLADLLPHEPGIARPPKLCLQMYSLYTAAKTDPTVCTVCPWRLLKPIAQRLGVHSLAAVGNSRGFVQIWDINSGILWREYQLIPAPIFGIEWLTIQAESPSRPNTAVTALTLCLIVHGWQPKDGAFINAQMAPFVEATKLEVKNYIALLNLSTGCAIHFRDSLSKISPDSGLLPSSLGSGSVISRNSISPTGSSYEEPIDIARVSQSGRYLALLVRNTCVELWNTNTLNMMKCIPFTTAYCGATLDWHHSPTTFAELNLTRFSDPLIGHYHSNEELDHRSVTVSSTMLQSESSRRESLILCTTLGNLRLVVVGGSEMDSTTISNEILQGLPASSLERIRAVAWFADLLAFGTSDGFIVLRDLCGRRTLIRMSSGLGWLDQPDTTIVTNSSLLDHRLYISTLSASSPCDTGVRRLCFLPDSPAHSLLLALTHDSLFVWQPHDMVLLCSAYFRGHLQRCLISADWACAISGSSDPAVCLIVGGDGALRLVRVGESGVEMIPTATAKDNTGFASEPITRFYGSSPVSDQIEICTSLLLPSLLPAEIASAIQCLLQSQSLDLSSPSQLPLSLAGSTRSDGSSEAFADVFRTTYSDSSAPCSTIRRPKLAPGFSKIQSSVDLFFSYLEQSPDFQNVFMRPSDTLVERCLWTAQLFGDSYETRFWRVVANRLLKSHTKWDIRYVLDLSWDLLAEHSLYRRSALVRLDVLERTRATEAHWNRCVHQLILLGQHERAVSLLLETPPDSSTYTVNMHRACLLAASASGRLRFSNSSGSIQIFEDTFLSTVKLVATNLLSNGHLDEGIELLCFIGLYSDACRYLESFDKWERSIWLAKCCLPPDEADQILRRWAGYLCSSQIGRKHFAVLIYVLLDDHITALKMLCDLGRYQLAARYLEACLQTKALIWSDEHESLFCTIFFEFSKILAKFGHHELAAQYCSILLAN
ncbi:unnamed protein product [Dicrocoelium dendriticum]|nr:unnamed protein product [Dicrocoelium dendriticum]